MKSMFRGGEGFELSRMVVATSAFSAAAGEAPIHRPIHKGSPTILIARELEPLALFSWRDVTLGAKQKLTRLIT